MSNIRINELNVLPGRIQAKVSNSRTRPYDVEIVCKRWDPNEWETVFEVLLSEARHTASLMNGELPDSLVFKLSSKNLNIRSMLQDCETACTCHQLVKQCNHASAVYDAFIEQAVKDPLILFEYKGLDRKELLTTLRNKRSANIRKDVSIASLPSSTEQQNSSETHSSMLPKQNYKALLQENPEFWGKEKSLKHILNPVYKKVSLQANKLLELQRKKSIERGSGTE